MRFKKLITTYFPKLSIFSSRSRSRSTGKAYVTDAHMFRPKDSKGQHSKEERKKVNSENALRLFTGKAGLLKFKL
ncbi:hypothetical protein N7528_003249 [Penicillium herquei]|nr:hypothetical protein N7528_003249 [Penicillium herquei]